MNIQEYISSGILELYVLDQLTSVSRQEVEAMRVKYPDVEAEIGHIESTLEKLAFSEAITPRAGLKDDILNKIKNRGAVSQPDAIKFPGP